MGQGEEETRREGSGDAVWPSSPQIPVGVMASVPDGVALRATNFGGRYEVGELLGSGGMGEVRRAHDRYLFRDVAVKIQLGDHLDPVLVARFEREARVQAQLEHPAIVPVHDLGVTDDGRVYIAMKRIAGKTLAAALDERNAADGPDSSQWTFHRLLTAFGTVCRAIELAHRRGVVHRDLKPMNIILGGFGEVYVLDWGIAKITGDPERTPTPTAEPPQSSPISELTLPGQQLGTPRYMAPEQAKGRAEPRSDVYALGAILYEILTGERFTRDRDASPRAEAENAPELMAMALRATSPRIDDRYDAAEDLAYAIDAYLEGDRDLELRRQLAQKHVKQADDAVSTALSPNGTLAHREAALRSTGLALALDPTNRDARRQLVTLLTTPPKEAPPAVQKRLQEASEEVATLAKKGIMQGCIGHAVMMSFVCLWGGLRDAKTLGVILGVSVAAFLVAMQIPLRAMTQPRWQLVIYTLFNALLATAMVVAGPLLLVPGALAANAFLFSVMFGRRSQPIVMAAPVLLTMLPPILQLAGLWPKSYAFGSGTLCVIPQVSSMSEVPTLLGLSIMTSGLIIGGVRMGGQMGDRLAMQQNAIHLTSWQLESLVADDRQK